MPVRLPMRVVTRGAGDNANVAAVTYGPAVPSGNYGDSALSSLPTLNTSSVTRTSSTTLASNATADGGRALQWHDSGTADDRWRIVRN